MEGYGDIGGLGVCFELVELYAYTLGVTPCVVEVCFGLMFWSREELWQCCVRR